MLSDENMIHGTGRSIMNDTPMSCSTIRLEVMADTLLVRQAMQHPQRNAGECTDGTASWSMGKVKTWVHFKNSKLGSRSPWRGPVAITDELRVYFSVPCPRHNQYAVVNQLAIVASGMWGCHICPDWCVCGLVTPSGAFCIQPVWIWSRPHAVSSDRSANWVSLSSHRKTSASVNIVSWSWSVSYSQWISARRMNTLNTIKWCLLGVLRTQHHSRCLSQHLFVWKYLTIHRHYNTWTFTWTIIKNYNVYFA